jgi:hypothetical protein
MRWWRPDPLVLVIAVLAVVVGLPPAVYLADALLLRFRMANGPGQPLEATTVYLATRLKSGKLEIFSDQPQTEVCAHALFPHFGYRPCWYLRRTGFVKVI